MGLNENSQRLQIVNREKDLGILIDGRLRFDDHMSNISMVVRGQSGKQDIGQYYQEPLQA